MHFKCLEEVQRKRLGLDRYSDSYFSRYFIYEYIVQSD